MASPPEAGNNNTSPPADSSPPSPPPPTPTSPPESSPATPTTPPSEPSTSPPPPSEPTASPPPPSEPSTSPPPPSEPSTSPPPPSGKSTSPPSPSPPSPPSPETPTQSPPPQNSNTPTTPADSPPPASNEGDPQTPAVPALPRSPPPPRRPSSNHSPPPSSSSENNDLPIILGIIIGGLVILLLVVIFLKWRKSKKRQYYGDHGLPIKVGDQYHKGPRPPMQMDPKAKYHPQAGMGMGYPYPVASSEFSSGPYGAQVQSPTPNKVISSFGSKYEFSYEALAAATNEFAQANLLGQGGFGYVHKGVLPDGTVVAVKSLKAGSGQGEREFQAEVEIISRVHHRYLVSLVGYCIAGQQRMLVYEYVPNNTLEFHLHGEQVMDWASRRRIAVGSAKGLAYLHEDCHPRIIHRDIKSANILLDFNFEAKVADFGLAKLTTDNYTHVSTRVMGTFGYLAPEYAASGKLTEKSDVFSFGVMLLEIITGRRPIDPTNIMEDSLVDWARPLMTKALETGDFGELLDPRLGDKYDPQEMARMITCAAASIRHSARKRPRMSQIVRALDGNASLEDLNEGVKPGESAMYNPYNTGAYNSDIMRFRKMVLSADDFNSGPSEPTQSPGTSAGNSREMGLESPIQKPMQ